LQIMQDRQRSAWPVTLSVDQSLRQRQIKGHSAGQRILPGFL
jgi:hypothetical protein